MHLPVFKKQSSFLGTEHKLQFTYCSCEPLPITMARANLWPASPSNPSYAFSFALLDWAEALLLECQVSLQDFCHALKFRSTFRTFEVSKNGIYLIIMCFKVIV